MYDALQPDFQVGNWLVEPGLCRISCQGHEVHLQARWMSVLVYLAANTDHVVAADEIINEVWGDIRVTQDSVYLTVSQLRKALAEDPENLDYIETIPKRGYRLVAPVVFPEIEAAITTSRSRKRLLITALMASVLLSLVYFTNFISQDDQAVPLTPNSIAVLPFVDLESGKNSNLSVLFADDLMHELTTIEGLEVMARTSSFTMDERNATAQEIGQQLGVSTILEGSIRRDSKTIHVTAQLINTYDGFHLWSSAFDRDISAFWEIQDEMARQIAEAMGLDMPPAFLKTLDPMDRPIVRRSRVNSYTSNIQERPTVFVLKNGRYIISWRSKDQDGSNWGAYAQLYDEESRVAGNEFRLNKSFVESQYNTVIAGNEGGSFVAAWQSWSLDGSGWGVVGRAFDKDGVPKTAEISIDVYNEGEQLQPAIAIDPKGRYLTVYAAYQPEGSEHEILARWSDTDGIPIGEEYQLNTLTRGRQVEPRLVKLGGVGFAVVWRSLDGSGYGIVGRLLDGKGRPVGPEFSVNSFESGNQDQPDLIALGDGGFLVAWNSINQDHGGMGGMGVFAQRFDAVGKPVGSEFGVSAFTSTSQNTVALTALDDDGFFAAWESEDQAGSGMDIFGRRFDASDQPMGPDILINVVTNSYQRHPSLATLTDGSVLVAFGADDWDGSYFGIFSRRLVFNQGKAMQGEVGADTFVFDEPFEHAEIQGFDAEIDRIALPSSASDFDALRIETIDGGLMVYLGTSTIKVLNAKALEAGHFLF